MYLCSNLLPNCNWVQQLQRWEVTKYKYFYLSRLFWYQWLYILLTTFYFQIFYKNISTFLHCDYTVVTLLLCCYYTVVTLLYRELNMTGNWEILDYPTKKDSWQMRVGMSIVSFGFNVLIWWEDQQVVVGYFLLKYMSVPIHLYLEWKSVVSTSTSTRVFLKEYLHFYLSEGCVHFSQKLQHCR